MTTAVDLRFEWDEAKADANRAKHRVTFDECQTVFGDPYAVTLFDHEHAAVEDRFIDIGLSANGRVLVVIYTESDEQIRIISCRRATLRERRQYEERAQ